MNNRTAKLIRRHCEATGASKKQYRRMKRTWDILDQKNRHLARAVMAGVLGKISQRGQTVTKT